MPRTPRMTLKKRYLLSMAEPIYEDGELVNRGKDYVDYLEDEKKRNWKNRKDNAVPLRDYYPHSCIDNKNKV